MNDGFLIPPCPVQLGVMFRAREGQAVCSPFYFPFSSFLCSFCPSFPSLFFHNSTSFSLPSYSSSSSLCLLLPLTSSWITLYISSVPSLSFWHSDSFNLSIEYVFYMGAWVLFFRDHNTITFIPSLSLSPSAYLSTLFRLHVPFSSIVIACLYAYACVYTYIFLNIIYLSV